MKWDNLVLLPLAGFIQWPLAALVPAGLFGMLFWRRRKPLIAVAAAAWALYALYESLMKARVLCTGECNIRVDLLLIIPALYLVSLVAVVKFFRSRAGDGAA